MLATEARLEPRVARVTATPSPGAEFATQKVFSFFSFFSEIKLLTRVRMHDIKLIKVFLGQIPLRSAARVP